MKKIIGFMLILCMMLSSFCVTSLAEDKISVTIDGKEQNYDVMPVNINGRVLVPMRGIFEALGAQITWRDDIKTVTATKGAKEVIVTIDSLDARVDKIGVKMDVAPTIIDGRTMVPVRFVSEAMGEDVAWDDTTKTVIITHNKNSGLKKLVSDYHRPIPTEFTKSNALDDLIYYDKSQYTSYKESDAFAKDPDEVYKSIKAEGKVILGIEDAKNGKFSNPSYGTVEVVPGEDGKDIIKITNNKAAAKSGDCIYRMDESLKGDYNQGDVCLLVVTMRTISGGDANGVGKIQLQTEEPATYKKDIWEEIYAGKDWSTHYFAYIPDLSLGERYNFGIRPAFYEQTIEIKDLRIINYGSQVKLEDMPMMGKTLETKINEVPRWEEFEKDAAWRKSALESIEKNRKGDFNVVVLDKDGNPIKDAQVELDMFEHEFEFGSAMRQYLADVNSDYAKNASKMFNAGVEESSMKWDLYEKTLAGVARKNLDVVKQLGLKYYRGHTLIWEDSITAAGNRMIPEDVEQMAINKQTDAMQERIKNHINRIMSEFKGELTEWDVVNETIYHKEIQENNGGIALEKTWFDIARKAEPGVELFYNEAQYYFERTHPTETKEFYRILDEMVKLDVDFDGIGLQSHYDKANYSMEEISNLYKDLYEKYGKELKVTEYSCAVDDKYLQAAFTRDMLITTFADPNVTGFIMWGFWDGSNFAKGKSPVFDEAWNLKPCGEQYVDLIYNKWWTRDAKATTDANGKASVRGFYGDYDVKVEANGKTVTDMVSFHKGYDNTLYIVIE